MPRLIKDQAEFKAIDCDFARIQASMKYIAMPLNLNKLKLGACPKEKIDEMMKKLKKAWEKHINTPLSD